MSNFIQTNYGERTYHTSVKIGETRQAQTAGKSFLDMVTQAGMGNNMKSSTWRGTESMETASAYGGIDLSIRGGSELAMCGTKKAAEDMTEVKAPSLEQMLKAKYPGLAYHVFDASSSAWRTRNDYPHYLLYQQDIDTQALENWKPTGPNPFYGSVDGKFIAPKEIKALSSVPPGSKAVVIHPKVQERMEQDPEYAFEIMERIDTWFAFDVARNEAIRPGCTVGMSQAVAIGEDGSIVNAQAHSSGREITQSSDEMVKAYYLRLAKRADFMRWLAKEQIKDGIQEAQLESAMDARARLAEMMESGRLLEIFGEKIAGTSTREMLAITKAQVWGI